MLEIINVKTEVLSYKRESQRSRYILILIASVAIY